MESNVHSVFLPLELPGSIAPTPAALSTGRVQYPARFEIGLALNNPNPMMNGSRAAAFQESEGRVRPIEEGPIIAAHLQAECAGCVRGPKP